MKHIDFIDRLQQRAAKMPSGMDYLSYVKILQKLKLPTLVYTHLDMINVYDPWYDQCVWNST